MGLSKIFPCLRKKEEQKQNGGNNSGAGNTNSATNSSNPPQIPPIDQIANDSGKQKVEPPHDEKQPKDKGESPNKISQRVWDRAFDDLAEAAETKDLVEAYAKVIPEALKPEGAEKSTENGNEEAAAKMRNPDERRELMRASVEAGIKKLSNSKSTKLSDAAGTASSIVLGMKDTIDLAVSTNPQAALPWAGVCIGLQVKSPPGPRSVSD
jgi:hypothetical protein